MDINNMTIGELRQVASIAKSLDGPCESAGHPLVGESVFVRTVTYHYTGRLVSVADGYLRLGDAAWVASSGRFAAALETGDLSEIEPYPGTVYVASGVVVDICKWTHSLPRATK